jgi:TRAP-type mannitol/chloroaromatic compound transport system permease large subunit
MIPPLALILLVLGSIFFGVATPTEAGALGALGAISLSILVSSTAYTWSGIASSLS